MQGKTLARYLLRNATRSYLGHFVSNGTMPKNIVISLTVTVKETMQASEEALRTLTIYSKEQCLENKYVLVGSEKNFVTHLGGNAMSCEVSGGKWRIFSEPNFEGHSYVVHPGGSYEFPDEMGMPETGAASAQLTQ